MTCACENKKMELIDLSLLDEMLLKYKDQPGISIPVLQKTQEIYGYLPRPALSKIARETGIDEAKLYGVATFYAQFRMLPVGKHMISLCQGTACHVNGANLIEDAVKDELGIENGETTSDGLFTLSVVACLGCCSLAPVMMIDQDTHARLTPDKTKSILRQYKKEG